MAPVALLCLPTGRPIQTRRFLHQASVSQAEPISNVRSKLGKAIESVGTSVGREDKIDVDSSLFHWGRNHVDFAADLNIEDRRNLAGCSGQIQSER